MPVTLDKLKTQREQLNARIQKLEAAGKARGKKQDTRRKILVGAYMLDKATREGTLESLKNALDDFLIRKSDRTLFDLPEKTQECV